jgi:hypothetical protein
MRSEEICGTSLTTLHELVLLYSIEVTVVYYI